MVLSAKALGLEDWWSKDAHHQRTAALALGVRKLARVPVRSPAGPGRRVPLGCHGVKGSGPLSL